MDNIYEQISCPICFQIPEQEVFQCRNGHNICRGCSRSMERCPQCREPFGEVKVRNRAVEAIVQSLRVDCPNKANGCPEQLLPDFLETHTDTCEYRVNNVKLCQHIGFNCGYKVTAQNVSSIIQHLLTEHGATTQTVSKFCMKLDGFRCHGTAGEDKTWPPHVIQLADTYIVIAAHLKNDMLSCVGVILKKSTVQQDQPMMECQIKGLTDEAIDVVWHSPILSLVEIAIAKHATAPSGPLRMDYIRHYFMSADGSLSLNVSISQPKAVRDHLRDGAFGGGEYSETGVIAKTMYDDVGDQNKTLSVKMGDTFQVKAVVNNLVDPVGGRGDRQETVLALCIYPYEAWNEEEITLKKGDIVHVISTDIFHGWWKCEFNGKTGLVPENKLTLVNNVESSKPDQKDANINTNPFRWVQCKGGKRGTKKNSVIGGNLDSAIRAAIPGLNFKVPGSLHKGETTAVICFKNVAFRVTDYEILCIPEGYWGHSEYKNWNKLIPEGSISTGVSPDGTETYLGSCYGFVSINAKEGYCNKVTGKKDGVRKETEHNFTLAVKP